jgi:hypothetical protein
MIKSELGKKVLLGTILSVSLSVAAQAAPVTFTFDPGTVVAGQPTFTANKLNVLDYARVDLGSTVGGNTAFTETGFLQLNNVSLANNSFTPTGLNSAYSIYFAFNAAGTQSAPTFGASSNGVFSSLNYTLYEAPGTSTFGIDGSNNPFVNNTGTPTALATGYLIGGATGFSVIPGQGVSPNATVTETVQKLVPGFFVQPFMQDLILAGAFNNDVNIVTVLNGGTSFTLDGGGGDVTFTVPEPVTLGLLGTGMVALGAIRRRRR